MENKQDCTKVYSIKGYAVQDNGIVRNSYGEYIGQLSDLEECDAKDAEIAKLQTQIKAIPTYEKAHELEGVVAMLKKQVNELSEIQFQSEEKGLCFPHFHKKYEMMRAQNNHLKKQLEEKETEISFLKDPTACSVCGSCGVSGCCSPEMCKFPPDANDWKDHIEDLREMYGSELKAKDELLEKMRVALEKICNCDDRGEYGDDLSLDEWVVEVAHDALALLSESLPKPLSKEVKGSEE